MLNQINWKSISTILVALGFAWAVDCQTALVAIISSLVVWLINWLAKTYNKKIGRQWLSVILFVIATIASVGFKYFQGGLVLPPGGDPATIVNALIVMAGEIVGYATIFYNLLGKKIFGAVETKMLTIG